MAHCCNIRGAGADLHSAIDRGDWPSCERILKLHGSLAGNWKNSSGSTPLMQAANGKPCKKHSVLLVDALLAAGCGTSAAEKNRKGRTAADIALARGDEMLATRLRALIPAARVSEPFQRCEHCSAKLRRRSKLEFVADKVRRGEEVNPLLVELFSCPIIATELARPQYHRINSCLEFRKEATESMALLSELKCLLLPSSLEKEPGAKRLRSLVDLPTVEARPSTWSGLHIVDLCSGCCLTAALALQLFPGVAVTCVDVAAPTNVPHFAEAGVGPNAIAYLQMDIFDPLIRGALQKRIADAASTQVVVFGMHCCGELSISAVKLFEALEACAILLMPCCLPSKKRIRDTNPSVGWRAIFDTSDQKRQYTAWASYLQSRVDRSLEGTRVNEAAGSVESGVRRVAAVLSSRNALIVGVRRKEHTSGASGHTPIKEVHVE